MNFAVIGKNVNKSLSPKLHASIYNQLNLPHIFKPISIEIDDVGKIVNKLKVNDLDGISITSPYKCDFINYIDEMDSLSNRIGAINCIGSTHGKLIGYNTDYYGFERLLTINNLMLDNKKIFVFGAGGASAAICTYLLDSNYKFIIMNRSLDNIYKMLDRIKVNTNNISINSKFQKDECDIIINCTAANADIEDTFSFCIDNFLEKKHIIDINYTNSRYYKSYNNYINGIDMLLYQGIKANEIWLQKGLEEKLDIHNLKKHLIKK